MAEYELYHYGVKGMKWGVRRFQNKDGTLTSKGKKRYSGNRGDIEKQIDPESDDQWIGLQKEIEKKSGDWYNQIGVSKRFEDTIKWAGKAKKKLEEELKQYRTKGDIKFDEARKKLNELEIKRYNSKGLKKFIYGLKADEARGRLSDIRIGNLTAQLTPKGRAKADEMYFKRRELEKAFKKKLESRLASTILRDLGYNDTKAGRQFLIDYELLSSD
uniref:Uncharacterized protein n=1 Tax=Siphoviridae sp. ctgBD49 TaxID=2826420 RepID=A0A8S5QNU6_9CAUD|nr:MAG TPA: hypothetical protein [Siphoviridae sp. ctgBD49]